MSSAILLLSGGRSSRMGQDKASLAINGQPLLQWQRQRFEDAGFTVISHLQDRHPGYKGPLAGIDAALHFHPEVSSWWIVPVDMPEVSPACLKRLQQASTSPAQPVCFQDCPLPLYLPATPALQETLTQWLSDANGKRSVYALMFALDGHWLEPASDQHNLFNINTPEQWQHYLEGAAAL